MNKFISTLLPKILCSHKDSWSFGVDSLCFGSTYWFPLRLPKQPKHQIPYVNNMMFGDSFTCKVKAKGDWIVTLCNADVVVWPLPPFTPPSCCWNVRGFVQTLVVRIFIAIASIALSLQQSHSGFVQWRQHGMPAMLPVQHASTCWTNSDSPAFQHLS